MAPRRHVIPSTELGRQDVGRVGGKHASLGELTAHLGAAGVRVPPGFATTAQAYEELLTAGGLRASIAGQNGRLHGGAPLNAVGSATRALMLQEVLPVPLQQEMATAYEELARATGHENPQVAVRSSATAEDLPEAGFAGQQRPASMCGDLSSSSNRADDALLHSSPTVPSTAGSAWTVVSGQVDPDEYTVFRPSLKDPLLNPLIDVRVGSEKCKTVAIQRSPAASRVSSHAPRGQSPRRTVRPTTKRRARVHQSSGRGRRRLDLGGARPFRNGETACGTCRGPERST